MTCSGDRQDSRHAACKKGRLSTAMAPTTQQDRDARACAIAWCEFVPALLQAQDRREHDPGKALRLHGPMREAQRIAAEYLDETNPGRPRARQTLEDVKRVRTLVASHRINRAGRHLDTHPAFRTLPGHSADGIMYWGQWR